MLPNFLLIGAGKSGTTTLYEWLKAHPEIFMSPVKEPNFFALAGETVDAGDDPLQLRHYPWSVTTRSGYEALFDKSEGTLVQGEASPMYLYSPKAPSAIKDLIPNVKLVAILREPVDRLHSRVMHLAREGREPKGGYADIFDTTSIWWQRNDLIREGFYYRNLKRYCSVFPTSQLKVFLYDDLKNSPDQVLQDLYSFLGVDDTFKPDLQVRFNPSGRIKNKWLDQLIGQKSIPKEILSKYAPELIRMLKRSPSAFRLLMSWRASNLKKTVMPKALHQQVSDIYRQEILALQKLIGRDLTHWLSA